MIRKIDCDNCHGGGTILCPVCGGNEKDHNGRICSYCEGMGIILCNKCDGHGTIDVEVNDDWVNMGW